MSEMTAGSVTVADLYKEIVQVRNDIGAVAVGVRLAEERHITNVNIHDDHERRVRALERSWWRAAGAAAVISVAVSWATAWVTIRGR